MKKTRLLPVGANTFLIKIDSYQDGRMNGRLRGSTLPGEMPFTSLSRLIFMLDDLMDMEREQVYCREQEHPGKFNFELEVLFRQNYSWQGKLTWLDQGQEASFRSVLELLILLETILA
jgi:hypothetical protein